MAARQTSTEDASSSCVRSLQVRLHGQAICVRLEAFRSVYTGRQYVRVLEAFRSVYTGRQYVRVLGAFRSVYTGRQYVRVLGVTSIVTCVVLESVSLTPYFKEGNPWGGGFQQS